MSSDSLDAGIQKRVLLWRAQHENSTGRLVGWLNAFERASHAKTTNSQTEFSCRVPSRAHTLTFLGGGIPGLHPAIQQSHLKASFMLADAIYFLSLLFLSGAAVSPVSQRCVRVNAPNKK